ncbi:MAG: hypothetical protein AAF219_10550, partial [Myxococcota bacterium]
MLRSRFQTDTRRAKRPTATQGRFCIRVLLRDNPPSERARSVGWISFWETLDMEIHGGDLPLTLHCRDGRTLSFSKLDNADIERLEPFSRPLELS